MRLRFDLTFDAGAWPDVLAGRDAVAGEAVVGPRGLAGILETALGLGGHRFSDVERAAALVPRALSEPGFWSKSAVADPLGTARQLLALRDDLCMEGWQGETPTRRLAQLARLTAGLNPGFPDRLAAICGEMERRGAAGHHGRSAGHAPRPGARRPDWPIGLVERLPPLGDLPGLWSRAFRALAAMGTAVVDVDLGPTAAAGDLAAAQRALAASDTGDAVAGLDATGDGSLQLLRPGGVLQAAEEVAAWLACQDDLGDTLIVNPDPVLDAALARFGLPTTGARPTEAGTPLLQVLPLALQMRWIPPDPAAARKLLLLPATPVPAAIARRLVAALDRWPAVDSDAWRRARSEGLAALGHTTRAAGVGRTLDELFTPEAPHDEALDSSAIRRTSDAVASWLAEQARDGALADGAWSAAVRQVELVIRLLELTGQSALDAAQLGRYLAAATEAALRTLRPPAPHPATAGVAAVGDPGGVAGPATRVVWWNFTLESETPLSRRRLAPKDEVALAHLGAATPNLATRAMARAARYRRPLAMASEALLLVCPETDPAGAEGHPHPLWDEITAALGASVAESRLTVRRPLLPRPRSTNTVQPTLIEAAPTTPSRSSRQLVGPASPRDVWRTALPLSVGRTESPSSLGTLVGCPFRWAAQYLGGVRPGLAGEPPRGSAVLGRLAHHILGRVLAEGPSSPAQAKESAAALFDAVGPRLDAYLFLPGSDAARSDARRLVASSAAAVTALLQGAGLEVEAVEEELEAEVEMGRVRGRADLVLGPRRAVLDLKLGGLTRRRHELRGGTAHQLATYGRLLAADGEFPAVGYFILRNEALLTTQGGAFGATMPLSGPGPQATWRGLVAAVEGRRGELGAGIVAAPGSVDEAPTTTPKATLEGGTLNLPPECGFCDLAPLCGRSYGRARPAEGHSWAGGRGGRRFSHGGHP